MGQTTGISWTDHTFNPWIGCSKVHAGCAHCYAERDFDNRRGVAQWGPHGTRIVTSAANWNQPLKWNRDAEAAGQRRRVFCASLADVFESWIGPVNRGGFVLAKPYLDSENRMEFWTEGTAEDLKTDPQGWRPLELHDVRKELFRLIDATPWLDWLVLTKRPENVRRMWPEATSILTDIPMGVSGTLYRPNVWIGTSVSNDETADQLIPELMKCRDLSPVLFVSAEPLLGPLDISIWTSRSSSDPSAFREMMPCIDWVIAGGESGPQFRAMEDQWVRDLRDQCEAGDVPFFFKQWSGFNPKMLGKELDGREWCEFPNVKVSI